MLIIKSMAALTTTIAYCHNFNVFPYLAKQLFSKTTTRIFVEMPVSQVTQAFRLSNNSSLTLKTT